MNPGENELQQELRSIAEALTITSPTSFTFADLPEVTVDVNSVSLDPVPVTTNESLDEQQSGSLVAMISDMLYWNCYVQRFGRQPARPLSPLDVVTDAEFQAKLSEANQSASRWDPGWSVVQTGSDGQVQARKGDCHRAPVPGEFLFESRPGVQPEVGDTISIRVTRESTLLQYGFYYCFSEQIPDHFEEFNSVRFYFNLHSEGAAVLLEKLSSRLNRFQVPFRFKCPVTPALFNRLDSGVLYVPWRFLQIASRCVTSLLPEIDSFLGDDIPLFTKKVNRGIAMAEDPGELRSFGQYRCELLAEGLFRAWRGWQDGSSKVDHLEFIEQQFSDAGVSLDRPWLNPGSEDWLVLPGDYCSPKPTEVSEKPGLQNTPVESHMRDDDLLRVADQIGSRICRDALWSGKLCNWLEWDAEPLRGDWRAVYRALGPSQVFPLNGLSLYSGTAGLSLFLARLYRFSQEPLHWKTAIASARQVLKQVRRLSGIATENTLSAAFYTGWLGAVWAVAEIGRELNAGNLIEEALAELNNVVETQPEIPNTDIINGSAGLIVALIDLASRYDLPRLVKVANQHGEFLLNTVQKSERGYSWETLNVPVHHNLTGYGHGVSGIITALAELYRVTGEQRFESAVDEGLRYESSYFSNADQNWHDHRADVAAEGEPAFQSGWCHGAPGIGMARFRLLELGFDSELIRHDLQAATRTTLAKLSDKYTAGQNSFCLCHGHTGNSELPLLLSEKFTSIVESGREELLASVNHVARAGIEQFENTRIPWLCNTAATGETPVLFNGLAGIGYFYLRAFAPEMTPSVMLLRPDLEN